jgi:outer membrane protein TolC
MTRTKYGIILSIAAVLSFLPLPPAIAAESPAAGDGRDLGQLVEFALANNPELKASEERWRMTVEKAAQAGVLEDPMLMLQLQNGLIRDPFNLNRDPATAVVVGLSQTVPYFGKRDLQRQSAQQDAEADRWRLEERRIELRRMVKEAWHRIALVDRSREVLEKNIAALDDLMRFSETMYGVGQGQQQDVLKAQLERSKMEEMGIRLQQERQSLLAGLNSLLYRPPETAMPVLPVMADAPLQLDQADLEELADRHRPALKAIAAQLDKAAIGRDLAGKEFFPDFTFSFEYMLIEEGEESAGDDMYTASLSFNLPVQRARRHAMAAEAAAEQRMLLEERNVLRNQIRREVADSLAVLERNGRLGTLYTAGILAQAGSVLDAAIASYRAGQADFMKVLDSRMALFSLELEYHRAMAEYRMQLAALEASVGVQLPYGEPQKKE